MPVHLHTTPTIWYSVNWTYLGDETLTVAQHILRIWKFQKNVLNSCRKLWFLCNRYSNGQIRVQRLDYSNLQWMILHFSKAWNIFSIMYLIFFIENWYSRNVTKEQLLWNDTDYFKFISFENKMFCDWLFHPPWIYPPSTAVSKMAKSRCFKISSHS